MLSILNTIGNFDYIRCVRDDRSEQRPWRPESVRFSDSVQLASVSHVHVSYACRGVCPGKFDDFDSWLSRFNWLLLNIWDDLLKASFPILFYSFAFVVHVRAWFY